MKSQISATTSLYAFIASPAHHSKSPAMHNTAFEQLGYHLFILNAFDFYLDDNKDH